MVSSASSNASNNSNILIEQLQAAHAAIRDLERQLKDNQCIAGRRVADVKRDGQQCLNEHQQDFSERRNCRAALPPTFISSRGDDQNDDTSETPVIETLIQELIVSRSAQKKTTIRNDKLRQELVQFRKRDNAVRDVFLSVYRREFRTEKELRKEADRLEGWKNKVQQKYRNLRSDQKRLACDQLKFEEKQMILRTQQAPRDASEDAINYFSINPKYDRAQMRPLGEVNPWSAGKISRHFAMGEPLDIWDGKPEQFHKIQKLLRKHDYYAGWLDAMRANDHQKTTAMQSMRIKVDFVKNINGGTTNYLYDRSHPRNPMNAGLNVGLLFGWSALCEEHNVPEHDVRLDDRIWKRKDLERIATEDHFGDSDFWVGVTMGTEKLRLLFELKMKSNKWNHHEDPDQMEHMQPDAMPPRHKWEEQPPPFGQGTVRIF